MIDYLVFLLVGKIAVYFLQTFPYKRFIKWEFLLELFECDLCLGVWVYTFLCFAIGMNFYTFYVPMVSEILSGASASFIMHLLSIGWRTKFSTIVIEG